jgi:hypothetical protein
MMAKLLKAFSRIPRLAGGAGASVVASGAWTHAGSFFTRPERVVSLMMTRAETATVCVTKRRTHSLASGKYKLM